MVIDGLFGSGLNRPLTGGFAAMVNYINQSEAEVVAIDIPSGLFGEDNRKNDSEAIIKASLTLTFGFPKLAFLFPENEQYVGGKYWISESIRTQFMRRLPLTHWLRKKIYPIR